MNIIVPTEKYREYISRIITDGSIQDKGYNISFRCPVCGDSIKNKFKKRGYLLISEDHATMGCFKCSMQGEGDMAFGRALKVFFPELFEEWKRDVFKVAKFVYGHSKKKIYERPTEDTEEIDYSKFIPILYGSGGAFDIAKDYCLSRKIPNKYWKYFHIAIDGKYKNRLIIPYYNRDDSFTYFNARDVTGTSFIKYLKPELGEVVYNNNFIDYSKPFFILEGEVDSMFIPNSCAVGGVSKIKKFLSTLDVDIQKRAIILTDGDEVGFKAAYQLLKQGYNVFNWNNEMLSCGKDGKVDINQLVISGYFNEQHLDRYGVLNYNVLSQYVLKNSLTNVLKFQLEKQSLGISLEWNKNARSFKK